MNHPPVDPGSPGDEAGAGDLGRPPRSRRRLSPAVVIPSALVVAGGVAIAGLYVQEHGFGGGSEQQRVIDAIHGYYGVVRSKGLTAATKISCKEIRVMNERPPSQQKSSNDDIKLDLTIEKIEDVKIESNVATAKVTGHAQTIIDGAADKADTESNVLRLENEGGTWKMCTLPE